MLQQLTERVWYLPHDEPSDRPVLTYIEGDQLSVAVDAGASPAHVREFYTAITDKGLTIPEITILTHWHWDHSFGLCATNGFTMASKKTTEKLKEVAFENHAELYLWIPPSKPYYELQGVYKNSQNFSKILVFSSWEMVPRMIGAMISYEFECRTVGRVCDNTVGIEEKNKTYYAERRYPYPRLTFALKGKLA